MRLLGVQATVEVDCEIVTPLYGQPTCRYFFTLGPAVLSFDDSRQMLDFLVRQKLEMKPTDLARTQLVRAVADRLEQKLPSPTFPTVLTC